MRPTRGRVVPSDHPELPGALDQQ